MTSKFLSIVIILALLMSFVSAVDISAQSPIVQGQQWSFDADLSGLNTGEEAKLLVDGDIIFSVTFSAGKYFEVSSSSKVIDSMLNVDSGELTIVYVGLAAGSHSVEVKTNDDSDTVDVTFFEPVSKDEQEVMENKINTLQGEVTTLSGNISTLKTELSSKDAQISSLQMENSNLTESLGYLESNINLLEQEGKSKDEILTSVKDDLNLLLTEREAAMNTPIAGLFSFGSENSGFLLGIFALVALVVVGLFVKQRTTSIYSTPLFNKGGNHQEINIETPEEAMVNEEKESKIKTFFSKFSKPKEGSEVIDMSKKKKWAVESYAPTEEKTDTKKFELGDLIKKN